MERTLVAFTTLLLSAGVAHASHPPQTQHPFVATETRFARQLLPAQPMATARAGSRLIYLNREGAVLFPGTANDARTQTSSIVSEPTLIGSWDVDDDLWSETLDCVREIYRPFDVTITDEDPGDVPHMEAIFGGHPRDVGLPDNVAGVSPFTEDCSVIEGSIVFTFTDVMPDDARAMCEVMAQEIAHSYGLDHEMLASDPMTYLPYDGERTFQDVDAPCGETGNRTCGIGGTMCRRTQNSVKLLTERLGANGGPAPTPASEDTEVGAGCTAGGGRATLAFGVLALAFTRRRRSRG
ncbi:hypothetical protein BH11MYX3_BH11MYX3_18090 [soil metagenome]